MNDQSYPKSAPLFTWPQTFPTHASLDFGRLGGFAHKENDQIYSLMPLTQIFPHTRRYFPSVKISRELKYQKSVQTARNLQEIYPEFEIPSEYLGDIIFEESMNDLDSENRDPYMSGQLISVLGNLPLTNNKFIAFPMGQAGSELSDLLAISKLKFKTPIRQIIATLPETSYGSQLSPPLMAVRTTTGTTFFQIENPEEETNESRNKLKASVINSVPGQIPGSSFDQTCVTFNPILYGEAAIVDASGGTYLWKAERDYQLSANSNKFKIDTIESPQDQKDVQLINLWRSCEFAAHPKCLYVASRTNVNVLDFRISISDTTKLKLFDIDDKDHIFAFQRIPMFNSFQSLLATRNNIILLDQRFPNRKLLKWAHHIDKPSGLSTIMDKDKSIILTWTKNPPKLIVFRSCFSSSGLISSIDSPALIPSFHDHPTYNRSKILRTTLTNVPVESQDTEELSQPLKLPPLTSALLLRNDIHFEKDFSVDYPVIFGTCFSTMQLSYTGALYSQDFYVNYEDTNSFLEPDIPSMESDMQIIEMPSSVSALQTFADRDVGTNPEIQLKRHQTWSFDRIWKYAARELRYPFIKFSVPESFEIGIVFLSWKSVERYIEFYTEVAGFNCGKKSVIQDVLGYVLSISFFCTDKKVVKRRLSPCYWEVTFSRSKNDNRIFVTKFNNNHNHETFTSIYQSERWIKKNMIDPDLLPNAQLITYQNHQSKFINYQIQRPDIENAESTESIESMEKNMESIENIDIIFEMINKAAHPMTLYELLKNMPNLDFMENSGLPRVTQYGKQKPINSLENKEKSNEKKSKSLEYEKTERIIDWTSVDTNIILNKILSENFEEYNLINTYLPFYGFPFNNINKDKELVEEIKFNLRKYYLLPASDIHRININDLEDENIQQFENELLNGTNTSNVDDNIKLIRNSTIEEVANDLALSSYSLMAKNEQSSSSSTFDNIYLTSNFLPPSKFTSDSQIYEPISLKCTHSKSIGKQPDITDLQLFELTELAQSLLDDWIIGQDPKDYEFKRNKNIGDERDKGNGGDEFEFYEHLPLNKGYFESTESDDLIRVNNDQSASQIETHDNYYGPEESTERFVSNTEITEILDSEELPNQIELDEINKKMKLNKRAGFR
ncbi:5515_t:CDS:10 [Diversispora eburnea]|uniref:5515_t:CDS:1 n=2 Tax=Diversisporales TaxID=214509 RepID=A0A9N9FDK2_9GLOM|nr:5515_t:CDS:10 [Diversispora eburnea]